MTKLTRQSFDASCRGTVETLYKLDYVIDQFSKVKKVKK